MYVVRPVEIEAWYGGIWVDAVTEERAEMDVNLMMLYVSVATDKTHGWYDRNKTLTRLDRLPQRQ
jgi:hypothetical protein